jgi:hypothetical protein
MSNSIIDTPILNYSNPWWLPILSLSLTIYGILFLNWNLQPIVFLFWLEIILMSGAVLIRMLFAMDGKPFFNNFLRKLMLLFFCGIMCSAMIMLGVTFSFKVFEGGLQTEGFGKIPDQSRILFAGYVLNLILHYFANGRYKTANPMAEMMRTLMHLLVLLVMLMVFTMHLIPAYPQLNQAMWVGLSVVLVKFVVDWLFSRIGKPLMKTFSPLSNLFR